MPQAPKVKDGFLERPLPINKRSDINRARVLPPPRPGSGDAPETPHRRVGGEDAMQKREPVGDRSLDQPKSGFDYVQKRNQMMRGISSRGPVRGRSFSGRKA